MNVRPLFVLLVLVASTASCGVVEDEPIPEHPFWYDSGEATVVVNGAPIPRAEFALFARPSAFSDGVDLHLVFPRLSPNGTDELLITDIPRDSGVFPLPVPTGMYFERMRNSTNPNLVPALFTSGGDVLLAVYRYDMLASNELRVTAFDDRTDEVEGAFSLTLVKEYASFEQTPDTLHFDVPRFRTRVIPDDEWDRRQRATGIVHG